MKKYNPIYYLLFILLVMGAFASMAQNSYGLKIMGGVAFVFALVFLIQFITLATAKGKKSPDALAEPLCLLVLALIFGLRVFYIYFPYVEWLFAGTAALLAFFYLLRMLSRFRHLFPKNRSLAFWVVVFHISVILFLSSLAVVPYSMTATQITGAAAFVLLLMFIIAGLMKKSFLVEGTAVSALWLVRNFKDHSVIIVILLLLFSFYTGLHRAGLLPGIYSDEYPRAYFYLLDQASSKKEKPVDGRYKHEAFMESYSRFLKHHKDKP